jgi:hypothetical protein
VIFSSICVLLFHVVWLLLFFFFSFLFQVWQRHRYHSSIDESRCGR